VKCSRADARPLHDLAVVRFDEGNGIFAADQSSALDLGDVVGLSPGYTPFTITLHDAYLVVEDGTVVDLWPIVSRGPQYWGLAKS
jgi:D-serine deaminase-like pyridoxal phosphate-dependent protein